MSFSTLSSGSSGEHEYSSNVSSIEGRGWFHLNQGPCAHLQDHHKLFWFQAMDNLLNTLHAEASSECAILSESKTSVIKDLSSAVMSSGSSCFFKIPLAEGISSSSIRHSSQFSISSLGNRCRGQLYPLLNAILHHLPCPSLVSAFLFLICSHNGLFIASGPLL